jgi:hypothetical protein
VLVLADAEFVGLHPQNFLSLAVTPLQPIQPGALGGSTVAPGFDFLKVMKPSFPVAQPLSGSHNGRLRLGRSLAVVRSQLWKD